MSESSLKGPYGITAKLRWTRIETDPQGLEVKGAGIVGGYQLQQAWMNHATGKLEWFAVDAIGD